MDSIGYSVVDQDGTILYEEYYSGLLLTIIANNDVPLLNQYIAKYPRRALMAGETFNFDPFYQAVRCGSIDALRTLLELYDADPRQSYDPDPSAPDELLEARDFRLLNEACFRADINMARFLLDTQPAHADIHDRSRGGMTALLAAARSIAFPKKTHDLGRDSVAQGEELVEFLLDRGACARDVVYDLGSAHGGDEQPLDTVLSLAISQATSKLVQRLINEGADVHTKTKLILPHGLFRRSDMGYGLFSGPGWVWDVTPLHIGSFYSNVKGIRVLFENRGNDINITDMVSCRDSAGRIPLHFAAGGIDNLHQGKALKADYVSYTIGTIKLLLSSNPSSINVQDEQGQTALHHAIISHVSHGSERYAIAKLLCENGADASLRGSNGQTPLHCLASSAHSSEPTDTALIDLLLENGARVGDRDSNYNTPLHFAAKQFSQIRVVHALLSRGADVSARDSDDNTPLHFAAKNLSQIGMVHVLLSGGADVSARNSKGNTPLHEAALALTYVWRSNSTVDDRKVQDEMIMVLQSAGGSMDLLMDERNTAGKTPRQIREETRSKWLEDEYLSKERDAGRGRERGRGRVV